MKSLLNRFIKDESGATAIEYGLIAGLLSIVIVGGVTAAGTSVGALFDSVDTALQ
ncbi:Flp family type IVb pilin [Roseibium denhamense]|uniref:Pilus assembly protein Flp/PilA n=1 Tax=Roseibium denhamense TaxID=76305 RepID=A0ABY1P0F5_9HYPH|nr:Flp family type IVb pilin [Roseibium denhamense]MTI04908.1 Flp family type IVb pilin [Roseibium denhamense]SMP22988.1 pilus assembly protein Flp/PilA [Roseibium denhamense]